MNRARNLVGPRIRELRLKQGLTQPMLVARCQIIGWDISRETLAKVESQIRWVSDFELLGFAQALNVQVVNLLPGENGAAQLLRQYFRESNAGRAEPRPAAGAGRASGGGR